MNIDGGCLCGGITYEAVIDPERIAICHCTDCQVNSGSAFRWVTQVRRDNFRLITGQPKNYIKTADSGTKRALAFCPECGTSLYGTEAKDPQSYSLRLGTARQAKELTPKIQVWRRSALGWLSDIDALPKFDMQPSTRR